MLQNIINFIMVNKGAFAAAGVALLDLIFALNPAARANGLLHWVYNFIKSPLTLGVPASEVVAVAPSDVPPKA